MKLQVDGRDDTERRKRNRTRRVALADPVAVPRNSAHGGCAGPTLAAVVDRWFQWCRTRVDLAPSTVVLYGRAARHLCAWGQSLRLGVVDLAGYVLERRRVGTAQRTITVEVQIATIAFNWAVDRGHLGRDACLRVPRMRVDAHRFVINHRTPTPGEAAQAICAMGDDDWRLAALLLARTGARAGEVLFLRGRDLDEEGGRLALGATDRSSKTGTRWFPLDDASLVDLHGRSERGLDPLFDFGDVAAPIQALNRRLRAACDMAGVSRFTPHGLRRMVVTRLMRAGVNPGTAATLTGHSVQVMLRHYQQVSDEDRRQAVEQADLGELGAEGL